MFTMIINFGGAVGINSLSGILKDLYSDWLPHYYEVDGAKEELIRRIKTLSKAEQILYGIDVETGEIK